MKQCIQKYVSVKAATINPSLVALHFTDIQPVDERILPLIIVIFIPVKQFIYILLMLFDLKSSVDISKYFMLIIFVSFLDSIKINKPLF